MAREPEKAPWRTQDLDGVQRARQLEAVRQLRTGGIQVPLACSHCDGSVVDVGKELYECMSCGRLTDAATAHTDRQLKMEAIIRAGVDLPLRSRLSDTHTHEGGTRSGTKQHQERDRQGHR